MRMKRKIWDESLLSMIRSATKQYLRERLGKTEEENLEVGVEYPIVKPLLGVAVEEGTLRLVHVPVKVFLALLNDLIGLVRVSGRWTCVGTNDRTVVEHWIERLGLEPLDPESAQGYAMSHELVEWLEEPFSGIQLRYRSAHNKLLVLYRMFFLISNRDYYIIIEKLS